MNLYLIGYRGSGKSSVAPILAELLGWGVEETDEQVTLLAGCPIVDIFSENGEAAFRELETNVLHGISVLGNRVVSTGGGLPLSQTNRDIMSKSGVVIWLKAEANVLWARISQDDASEHQRPDLTDQGGLAEVQQVLSARTLIYSDCADYTVEVDSMTPQQVAEKIANWWEPVDR